MTDEEYFAYRALSSTRIKAMATGTPRGYWAKHVDPNRKPFEPTDAMRQGSLVDCLITCPEEFESKYALPPLDAPKRPTSTQLNAKKPSEATIEAIQFWHDFDSSTVGREVLNPDWLENALRIVEVLQADATIGPVLAMERQSQVAHVWTDPEYGIEMKYKSDLEPEDGSLIDLKQGARAEPRSFTRQAYSLGYDIQLDHYGIGFADLHGQPPSRYGLAVYEWKFPHECSLLIADSAYITMGHERRGKAIEPIMECRRLDQWPSHGESLITARNPSTATADDIDLTTDIEMF